jgi:hypothetical protein
MFGEDRTLISYSLDEQPLFQLVDVERTLCNYGGDRVWWSCSQCERRCATVYLVGDGWSVGSGGCSRLPWAVPSFATSALIAC